MSEDKSSRHATDVTGTLVPAANVLLWMTPACAGMPKSAAVASPAATIVLRMIVLFMR